MCAKNNIKHRQFLLKCSLFLHEVVVLKPDLGRESLLIPRTVWRIWTEPVGMSFQKGRNLIAADISSEQAREWENSEESNQVKELFSIIEQHSETDLVLIRCHVVRFFCCSFLSLLL